MRRIQGKNGTVIEVADDIAEMLLRNKGEYSAVEEPASTKSAPIVVDEKVVKAKGKGKAKSKGAEGTLNDEATRESKATEPTGELVPESTEKVDPKDPYIAAPAGNASTDAWAEYGARRGIIVAGLNRTEIQERLAALDNK